MCSFALLLPTTDLGIHVLSRTGCLKHPLENWLLFSPESQTDRQQRVVLACHLEELWPLRRTAPYCVSSLGDTHLVQVSKAVLAPKKCPWCLTLGYFILFELLWWDQERDRLLENDFIERVGNGDRQGGMEAGRVLLIVRGGLMLALASWDQIESLSLYRHAKESGCFCISGSHEWTQLLPSCLAGGRRLYGQMKSPNSHLA